MAGRGGRDRVAARKARLEGHSAETDPGVVLNAAARFLEARQRSIDEVRRHLTAAAYPADLIERAIERLTELRMLDDETFARSWVESRDRAHPRGDQALRRELAVKGIHRELIAGILEERAAGTSAAEDGEVASAQLIAARRLLARRAAALGRVGERQARRQRAYALLARNGFDPDVCREAVAEFERGLAAGDDSDAGDDSEPVAD